MSLSGTMYNDVFMSQRIGFTLTNSVDPDEMQHYAASHLSLHCLSKYQFSGFPYAKDEQHLNVCFVLLL